MKRTVKQFVKDQVKRLNVSGDCLEIGSYDVNGNLRNILQHTNYTGLDMRDGPNVDIVGNGNELPFPDSHFDSVICAETLEHDKFFWKTAAEIRRVLRPGGTVILTAPNIGFGLHEHPSDYWRFTEEGLKSLVSDWCIDIESSDHDRAAFVAGRKLPQADIISSVTEHQTTIVYYTDNCLDPYLFTRCQQKLIEAAQGKPIISVSQKPLDFGINICVGDIGRSHISLFAQMIEGVREAKTKYVALAEHDCIYSPEHFDWIPPDDEHFWYNVNHWFAQWGGEKSGMYSFQKRQVLSNLICNRETLLRAAEEKLEILQGGAVIRKGLTGACEPGVRSNAESFILNRKTIGKDLGKSVYDYKAKQFKTTVPNIDIRHGKNFSGGRKAKNTRYSLPSWGSFYSVMGVTPPGKWYQEAVINGTPVPTRRKKDTNEKRWQKFIKPLVSPGSGRVTDFGCNAGFYCRKFSKLGYTTTGVERDPEALRHAHYWEDQAPVGVRIVESDITEHKLTASKYVLFANVSYWLTEEQLLKLRYECDLKALNVIFIGRHNTADVHNSPADLTFLRKLFVGWEETLGADNGKHFSVKFTNPWLVERDVKELSQHQQFIQSKRFLPSYSKLIDTICNGEKFNPLHTDYYDYLKWRKFKDPEKMLKRHIKLVSDMKNVGMDLPLVLGRVVNGEYKPERLTDGDHRLIVAMKLQHTNILCRINPENGGVTHD